jgi:hypothetical protein
MNETTSNDDLSLQDTESDGGVDYDKLLDEYQERKTPATRQESVDPAFRDLLKEFKPIAEVAQRHLDKEVASEQQKTVEDAINTVKGDESLSGVSDAIVEGYLNLKYQKDPEFKSAFEARSENPSLWDTALVNAREALSKEISSMKGSSDKDDTEAALAAVKGTSQTELDAAAQVNPKELFAMSDYDFAEYKRNLGS